MAAYVLVSGFAGWLVVLNGMDISGCVRVSVSGFVGWLVVLDDMDISGCVRFNSHIKKNGTEKK